MEIVEKSGVVGGRGRQDETQTFPSKIKGSGVVTGCDQSGSDRANSSFHPFFRSPRPRRLSFHDTQNTYSLALTPTILTAHQEALSSTNDLVRVCLDQSVDIRYNDN